MTFLELCQTLRRECGVSGVGPTSVVGQSGEYLRLVEWIQQAWREIQEMRDDWAFMWAQGAFTTSPGIADYTLTSIGVDARRFDLDSFVLTDGTGTKRFLHRIAYPWWRSTYGTATLTNNVPTYLTDMPDGSIKLTAPPDGSYPVSFDYYRETQVLAANSDVPYLPARYHDIIWVKAMQYYAGYEDGREVAADSMARFLPLLSALESTQLPSLSLGHTPLGEE